MANLKALKLRIRTVKATQKITRAMQMVAASKLQHARMRSQEALPYVRSLMMWVEHIASSVHHATEHPLLQPRSIRADGRPLKHALLVLTADRGLCGGFNSAVVRYTRQVMASLEQQGQTVQLLCIGKKGFDLLHRTQTDRMGPYHWSGLHPKHVNLSDVRAIARWLIQSYRDGIIDGCTMVLNVFHNVLSQQPVAVPLVPFLHRDTLLHHKQIDGDVLTMREYEPSMDVWIDDAIEEAIAAHLFYAVLETMVGEQGAKMSAMDNATRNAKELIERLTLLYNRTRQANITKELIEIIAGADAV